MIRISSYRLVLLIATAGLFSQTLYAVTNQKKLWSYLGLTGRRGDFSYLLEPELRLRAQPRHFDQFRTNMSGGYHFSSQWSTWLSTIWSTDLTNAGLRFQETRIWQQISYETATYPINFLVRSRIEERVRNNSEQWNYRLRQRFTINKALTATINLVLYDELFINFNRPHWVATKTLAQNRASIGINQQASDLLNLGIGYINQAVFSRQREDNHVVTLHVQITFPAVS